MISMNLTKKQKEDVALYMALPIGACLFMGLTSIFSETLWGLSWLFLALAIVYSGLHLSGNNQKEKRAIP